MVRCFHTYAPALTPAPCPENPRLPGGSGEPISSRTRYPMFARLFTFCIILVSFVRPVLAAPTPAPPLQTPLQYSYCGLKIAVLDILDGTATGRTFAVALQATGGMGKASGSLAFYVGDDRYEARFHDIVAPGPDQSLNLATPLVVQFPAAVGIDGAYVASLDAPTPGACDIGNVWSPTTLPRMASGPMVVSPPFDRVRFDAEAALLPRTLAVLAARDPHPSCANPYQPPRTLQAAQPDYPEIARLQGDSGRYIEAVTVDPTGGVADVHLYAATARNHLLEVEALHSAQSSTFQAGLFRCKPVYGTYFFTVTFSYN
jgi:hypothetical protein